jgi:putative ABC transport system permease protein
MWMITLRDLQYRRRQFGIAVAGAALVFALALVATGIVEGFRTEALQTVRAMGADAWIVPRGVTGPFTSQSTVPMSLADRVRRLKGVGAAHPIVVLPHVARLGHGQAENVHVIGHTIGRVGDPEWGRPPYLGRGKAVVDEALGVEPGAVINIASRRLRVASVIKGRTYFAGIPTVYTGLHDAQEISFEGRPLASAVLVRGAVPHPPPGYVARSNDEVTEDLLSPVQGATTAVDNLRLMLWVVAGVIIGAVVYLSVLERIHDFAVLKAVGGSSRSLAIGVAAQAAIASLLSALIAAALAQALKGAFPLPVTITASAYLALPAIALGVGILASLLALRRALVVDPALAFAG